MVKSNQIGAIILGATAGVALIRFFNMPYDEREEFLTHLKERAHDLLDDAEGTVEKVKHHFAEIEQKPPDACVEKLFVIQKLLSNLFGSERRYLL